MATPARTYVNHAVQAFRQVAAWALGGAMIVLCVTAVFAVLLLSLAMIARAAG